MNERFEEIARRKKLLIDRCAADREELSECFRRAGSSLTTRNILIGVGNFLRGYPLVIAGLSSLLVSGYGGKVTRSAGQLVRFGRLARPLWSWWSTLGKRK